MGKWVHRISKRDLISRTGTCSVCGFVKLHNKGNGIFGCYRAFYARKRGQKNVNWKRPVRCVICGLKKRLVIDHNHTTGYFRGWVCGSCNILLGAAKDNVQILKNAIKYLSR